MLEIVKDVTKKANLADAHVIVCGGKGMGDEQGFQLIHEFAETLGQVLGDK